MTGARRATIHDVAKRAGVSTATVSYVLREVRSVRPRVRDAVLGAAAELDYRPNRVAASLRHNNTMTIGVVVPDVQNAFFMGVVQRVEARAHADGYKILLASSEEDADRESAHVEGLLDRRVNGLVVFPTLDDPPLRSGIDSLVVPVVFVDRGLEATETDTVAIDNAAAAGTATRHLIERGHRDIVLILSSSELHNMRDRSGGYRAAMAEAGLGERVRVVETGRDLPIDRARVKEGLRAARPTAVFAATNGVTLAALRALRELGRDVPGDISLLGFDGFDWMEVLDITAVRQPVGRLGDETWDCLRRRMADPVAVPHKVRLDCTLEIRGSTRTLATRQVARVPRRRQATAAGPS